MSEPDAAAAMALVIVVNGLVLEPSLSRPGYKVSTYTVVVSTGMSPHLPGPHGITG
jgi:hypothetical protein